MIGYNRSNLYYHRGPIDDEPIASRLKTLAAERPRWGWAGCFDNGSEFTSHAMLRWTAEQDVELHFIAPAKPTQNASIESLNGKIRDQLFNMHRFTTIFEARRRADEWKTDYNEVRPHSALGYQTPKSSQRPSKSTHPHSYQLPERQPQVKGCHMG
ncbi:MAG: integrase core domain-containing protein [Candidatus Cybelea sp.]